MPGNGHTPTDTSPYLVSIPEACRRLGLGRTAVYELIAAGELMTVRVGRRRLVPDAALVAFVDRLVEQQS